MSSTPNTYNLAFGRKWELNVYGAPDAAGTTPLVTIAGTTNQNESPKIYFEANQPGYSAFWYCDIQIYNVDPSIPQLTQGMYVTLSAGYDTNGPFGQIFAGRLFQSYVERLDVNDYRVTLHCLCGFLEVTKNFINCSINGPISVGDAAIRAMSQATTSVTVKYAESALASLKGQMLPRGFAYYGDPQLLLLQLAQATNSVWWFDGTNVNLDDLNSPESDAIVYTPETGLIGTPQQTQDGVSFKVLLNPNLRIKINPKQVQLDMSSIIVQKNLIGQPPSVLDQNNTYIIGAVRHVGDTRANEWYTECLGYTSVNGKLGWLGVSPLLMQSAAIANSQPLD